MGDSLKVPSSKNLEASLVVTRRKASRQCLVSSSPKTFTWKAINYMDSLYSGRIEYGYAGQIAIFLVKVAALEMFRRLSKAKCPFAWRGIQALQVFCYPPFKWLQRWKPFKGLVIGVQKFSRPLLFLSVATAISEELDSNENPDATNSSEQDSEPPDEQPTQDTRISDEAAERITSESWMLQLCKELEEQNITLPERINGDELRRFYAAANGDYSYLVSSIKKTIRWRETYSILLAEELESWSHLVFWHGCDVMFRPCLVIRLGLACSSLPSHDRPRFTQAIVSQLEHGVLHLVNMEDPYITVLMDCDGLSPLRFPMQMMRSCCSLFQDHFPNRLGCLFIIRLPPVVRMLSQTFIQVLRPTTRKKLRIEGEMYMKVLSEYLRAVPAFLGGKCTCSRCSHRPLRESMVSVQAEETDMKESSEDFTDNEDLHFGGESCQAEFHEYEQAFRTAIIAILMVIVFIVFLAGMYE